jgi:hypothetical protein
LPTWLAQELKYVTFLAVPSGRHYPLFALIFAHQRSRHGAIKSATIIVRSRSYAFNSDGSEVATKA